MIAQRGYTQGRSETDDELRTRLLAKMRGDGFYEATFPDGTFRYMTTQQVEDLKLSDFTLSEQVTYRWVATPEDPADGCIEG